MEMEVNYICRGSGEVGPVISCIVGVSGDILVVGW